MKIIDEKGRLFGKINVIDFIVLLLLLCLIPAFYFGYKIFTKKPVVETKDLVEITTDCLFVKLKPELLKLIPIGGKDVDENGQVIGEIVSLGQSAPYKYEVDIGGRKIIKEDQNLKQIEAKLKLKVEVRDNRLYYKNKMIKNGFPIVFKTTDLTLTAIPFIEKEEEREMDLYIVLKDLDENLIKEISVGDKEIDKSGNTIAEILSLDKVENSSLEFDLGDRSVLKREDRTKKQISVKMRLKCQVKSKNQLFFKGNKIEYNTPLEFKTDAYTITGFLALKEKWISLQVKFSEVAPEIARMVQKGDIEKDVFEKTIAKIGSIISNEPASVTTIFESKFITVRHPYKRDIVAFLDVLCVEKEGAYYFKDHLAKMGIEIVFNTDSYSISGMIIGIKVK